MSLKAELEALIIKANSSLEDLEAILRRAQLHPHKGTEPPAGEAANDIQTQLDTVRQRILTSLLEMRETYNHDQERLSDLEGELKLDLENVRQCAIDYFIRGQYQESTGLLSFLCKIQPKDKDLQEFLDLSRRRHLERGSRRGSRAPDTGAPTKDFENGEPSHHQHGIEAVSQGGATLEYVQGKAGDNSPIQGVTPERDGLANPLELDLDGVSPELSIEPKILTEIELRTAAHIDETYRSLAEPTQSRRILWTIAGSLVMALVALFWVWRLQTEPRNPDDPTLASAKVAEHEDSLKNLREEAQALFDSGKLQEAARLCEDILTRRSQDAFAMTLGDQIRATQAEGQSPLERRTPPGEAAMLEQASPAQSETASMKHQPESSPPPLKTSPSESAMRRPAVETERASAPPDKELLSSPTHATPAPILNSPTLVDRTPAPQPVGSDILREWNKRIEAQDFEQARAELQRLESRFPGNSELKSLGERLKTEVDKYETLAASWVQKAEAAQSAGRLVAPPDESAVAYCNLALKADPSNQKALRLKKMLVNEAMAQARGWVQEGQFDAARLFYASMDYLALKDNGFPVSKLELKRELERLEFKTYSMVHEHKVGSCSGRLKFNAYSISYTPSGGSGDGFAESLSSVVTGDEGERLRIGIRDKTFRFRRDSGAPIAAVYQELISRTASQTSARVNRPNPNQDLNP